jgi:hypothetical protein
MSLLGSQVFASSSTPCWLSTGGGEVEGSIAVRDTVAIVPSIVSGTSALVLGPGGAPDYPYTSLIESTPVDVLTSLGSELSFYTRQNILATPPALAMTIDSTQNVTMSSGLTVTSNLDVLGLIQGPSMTPSEIINATKVITPIPTAPLSTAFAVDTPYPTVSGETYEISAKGRIFLDSGTPDPGDVIYVTLTAGATYPGTVWIYPVFPSAAGVSGIGLFDIFTRVKSDQALPSITVSVGQVLAGGSTAVYEASLYSFSATRVA